ncbi:MAG: alpha/beta hydrolase [Mycolicibacterium sp.]|nr:alpha/beta hydrolase [Mycolicibacterium sp.]
MATVKDRALAVGNRLGVNVIARLPNAAKRIFSGGKAVTIDGNTLDPSIQMLLAAQRATGVNGLVIADDTVASRANFGALGKILNERDVRVAGIGPVSIPGPAGAVPARHYRPAVGAEPAPLLVFFHGGGWVLGDLDSYDSACRLISRDAGVHVLAVDYRLAPEHPAPAAADDAYAAYRWARAHAAELGADPRRVAVGGDSAGGNLAALVTRLARDAGDPMPSLQWLIYPATDLRGGTRSRSLFGEGFLLTRHDMDWFQNRYVEDSGLDFSDAMVSPLLAADLSGLSPALVVTAGFDPLRDEGEQYATALRQAGVTVDYRLMPSMIHGFLNLNILGGAVARANAEMISAVRAHLAHR